MSVYVYYVLVVWDTMATQGETFLFSWSIHSSAENKIKGQSKCKSRVSAVKVTK